MCAALAVCCGGANDIVVPTFMQEQLQDVEEDVNMVPCTQVPPAHAKGAWKRPRKPGQWSPAAHGGPTTPETPWGSTPTVGAMAKLRSPHLTQQAPMLQIDPANDHGPPPPDTTPTPLREISVASR